MASMEMAFSFKTVGPITAVALGLFAVGACRPASLQGDFPRVSGSVLAGRLEGPFTGRVMAAGTKKPLSGAVVVVTWIYRRGVGVAAPSGYVRASVRTDIDGRYRVPSLRRLGRFGLVAMSVGGVVVPAPRKAGPGGTGVLTGVRLLVYKRGFVAYRSDRVFPEGRRRLDFVQYDNRVMLHRFSDNISRVAHLRFIGDVRALGADGKWVLEAASEELSGHQEQVARKSKGPLVLSRLIDESDLDVLFGGSLTFKVGRLSTMKPTKDSDSLHFEAVGKPQTYDLALRVWRYPAAELVRKYQSLMRLYPGSRIVNQVGNQSFVAGNDRILAHVFLSKSDGVLVSVTCGKDLCRDHKGLLKVVRLVQGRLGRLGGDNAPQEQRGPKLDIDVFPRKRNKPSFVPRLNR